MYVRKISELPEFESFTKDVLLTCNALNTDLSKIKDLKIYSHQMIYEKDYNFKSLRDFLDKNYFFTKDRIPSDGIITLLSESKIPTTVFATFWDLGICFNSSNAGLFFSLLSEKKRDDKIKEYKIYTHLPLLFKEFEF